MEDRIFCARSFGRTPNILFVSLPVPWYEAWTVISHLHYISTKPHWDHSLIIASTEAWQPYVLGTHVLRYQESKILSRAASPSGSRIWTPSSTLTEDKTHLILVGFLPPPFARVLSTTLCQCILSTFCPTSNQTSPGLLGFREHGIHRCFLCSTDTQNNGSSQPTTYLSVMPCSVCSYPSVECRLSAVRSATSQILKLELRE